MVWVAIETFSIVTKIFRPCVVAGIQSCDRVWGWARFGSRQRSPYVATEFFPWVGHSYCDKRRFVTTGFLRVVLRHDVFLSQPTRPAYTTGHWTLTIGLGCARYRVARAHSARDHAHNACATCEHDRRDKAV